MTIIKWLSDRSNITFLIAVVGFAMSIYNFMVNIVQNHTRIKVDLAHVFYCENMGRTVEIVNLKILNLSKNPVVLSQLNVKNDIQSGSFGTYRRKIYTETLRTDGKIVEEKTWFSNSLPVKIEGNGCANLLLISDERHPVFVKGSKNTLKLHTTKKTIKKEMVLTDFSEIKLLAVCREPDC